MEDKFFMCLFESHLYFSIISTQQKLLNVLKVWISCMHKISQDALPLTFTVEGHITYIFTSMLMVKCISYCSAQSKASNRWTLLYRSVLDTVYYTCICLCVLFEPFSIWCSSVKALGLYHYNMQTDYCWFRT